MKVLMFTKLMAEAEGGGGGGAPTETPAETPTETPAETPTETPAETPSETPAEEQKSALERKTAEEKPKEEKLSEEKPKEEKPKDEKPTEDKPKEVTDDDYLKAIACDDETKKAGGEGFEISKDMVKNLLPVLREANVSPEQTNKLANALAREQLAKMRDYREEQTKIMREGNEAAFKLFPEKHDWELMKVARDHFFKEADKDGNGGVMRHVIEICGIGNDPEFLSLLKFAGEMLANDSTPKGSGSGGGAKKVDYAKALGI